MKHLRTAAAAVFALTLVMVGACGVLLGKGPHVPSDYQGTTEITVANTWEVPLCLFAVYDQSKGTPENWLGDGHKQKVLAPGARTTFEVKPGTYSIVGATCYEGQMAGACGTYGTDTRTIEGPTLIVMGTGHTDEVAGATTLTFDKLYAGGQGGGGGDEATSGGEEGGEQPADEAPAESSESTSEPSEPSEPSDTNSNSSCRPSGATCDQSYQCCSNACVTHSPDDYCR